MQPIFLLINDDLNIDEIKPLFFGLFHMTWLLKKQIGFQKQQKLRRLTNDLNIDEIRFALANFIYSHARNIGLSLQSDGIDGPIEAVDIIDHVASTLPNESGGLWPPWLINATCQGDGLAFDNQFCVLAYKGLSWGICKDENMKISDGS